MVFQVSKPAFALARSLRIAEAAPALPFAAHEGWVSTLISQATIVGVHKILVSLCPTCIVPPSYRVLLYIHLFLCFRTFLHRVMGYWADLSSPLKRASSPLKRASSPLKRAPCLLLGLHQLSSFLPAVSPPLQLEYLPRLSVQQYELHRYSSRSCVDDCSYAREVFLFWGPVW